MKSIFLPLLASVLCVGCFHVPTGPTQHESRSIERDGSEVMRTELRMGAGTLKVKGGSPHWMEGNFTFNVPSWKPNLRYSTSGSRGSLIIDEPNSGQGHAGNTINEWDLRLNNDVPTDLVAHVGAGEAQLDVGALALRGVDIEMGAGELRLDLRGHPSHSYDIRVRGGAGEATIYLPRDVGIEADVKGGLGDMKVQGLHSSGGHWVNDMAGTAKVQLHLDIKGGVGTINVIAE